MNIKVSVIVPVYNVEQFLERCLESLVNQTLQQIEIITVDDASPDRSIDILSKFQKDNPNKIKIIRSKENLKQGGAKNLGIKASHGDFIGFVDSDDWIDLTMYEKLYNCAIETESDVVDCDYYEVSDTTKKVISNSIDQTGNLDLKKRKSLILKPGRMVTKIYKKELFTENNLYFPEKLFYEDNAVQPALMSLVKKLGKINEPLYSYRIRQNSTTKNKISSHHFDRISTSKIMIQNFKRINNYEIFKEEVEYKFVKHHYTKVISLCLNNSKKPNKEKLNVVRNYIKENFPNYRENYHFMKISTKWEKMITKATDINLNLAIFLNKLRKLF